MCIPRVSETFCITGITPTFRYHSLEKKKNEKEKGFVCVCLKVPLVKVNTLRTYTCFYESYTNTYTQNQTRSTSPVTVTLPLKLSWVPGTCLKILEEDGVKCAAGSAMPNGNSAGGGNPKMEFVVTWILLNVEFLALYSDFIVRSPGIWGMRGSPCIPAKERGCQFVGQGQARWGKEKCDPVSLHTHPWKPLIQSGG